MSTAPIGIVLGCTHYPLLAGVIAAAAGSEMPLIDSARETARDAARILAERGQSSAERPPDEVLHRFAVSDDPERFRAIGARFLGERLGAAEIVVPGGQ